MSKEAMKQEPAACDGDFPEGFDESFGIPAQALRQANAALCEVTNNRMWDVPALAERMMLFRTHTIPPAYDQGWKDGYKHGAWANTAAPVQEPPDDELTQALIERDETEAIADELAQAIAQITGADIGEHTSANCPWRRALDAAEDFMCHPPAAQRQWVGLTDEDIEEVWKRVEASDFGDSVQPFGQAIEAALRSKNT